MFREIGTTVEMSPLSPSECLVLAKHMIGEAVMAAHPEADLLPEGSDVILTEKSGGGNPLFVRNIAIVSAARNDAFTARCSCWLL